MEHRADTKLRRRAAAAAFLATGLATAAILRLPQESRPGWFELDGRPISLDGRRVEDWRHVNELLAQLPPEAYQRAIACFEHWQRVGYERRADFQAAYPQGFDTDCDGREFEILYAPGDGGGRILARVHRHLACGAIQNAAHPSMRARCRVLERLRLD